MGPNKRYEYVQMYDQVIRVLVSGVVFALFVPGFVVKLGGKYTIYVHALLFALVHHGVYMFLDSILTTVGIKTKGLYGEDGHGIQKKGLYGEDGHGIQRI
jgi:hypothetical protein